MSSILEQPELNAVTPGDTIQGFYILRKVELRSTRDGRPYLSMELSDRSGRCPAKVWEGADSIAKEMVEGEVAKIRGVVQEYQGLKDLKVEKIRMATDRDPVDPRKLLRASTADLEALYQRLLEVIFSLEDPHLKRLLQAIFGDETIRDKFSRAPGGKGWHHAVFGGLLEHTVGVVELCLWLAERYPNVEGEVLVAGALLHDIGKVEELGGRWAIDYTDEGRLIGHITQGAILVDRAMQDMEDFPQDVRMKVLHLILSHHGEKGLGAPVVPQTLEAQILYFADQLDSQINAWQHIIERDKDGQRTWSSYVKLIERFLYLGEASGEDTSCVD
jgi:3'-5' exoribonuclease